MAKEYDEERYIKYMESSPMRDGEEIRTSFEELEERDKQKEENK